MPYSWGRWRLPLLLSSSWGPALMAAAAACSAAAPAALALVGGGEAAAAMSVAGVAVAVAALETAFATGTVYMAARSLAVFETSLPAVRAAVRPQKNSRWRYTARCPHHVAGASLTMA